MLDQVPRLLALFHKRTDEDRVDQLISYYSVILITLCVVLVSAKQYVGCPLQCWVPAHFTGAMEQYTENYCWVQSTWFVPVKSPLPWDIRDREERTIQYYQWVPFILLLQLVICVLPMRFWRYANGCSGHDPKSLTAAARSCRDIDDPQKHDRTIAVIADSLMKPHHSTPIPLQTKLRRSFQTSSVLLAYLLTKLMFVIVLCCQFHIMTSLLSIPNPFFGWHLWRAMFDQDKDWERSGVFPRVTMCDFEVKVLGNRHRYTVQCVLMINMFNEKIFMFLWFWFSMLLLVSFVSLIDWMFYMCECWRNRFVLHHLRPPPTSSVSTEGDRQQIDQFVKRYLDVDVVFLLVMIKSHAGRVVTQEILAHLWKAYISTNPPPSILIGGTTKKDTVVYTNEPQLSPSKKECVGFVETLDEQQEHEAETSAGQTDTSALLLPHSSSDPPPLYSTSERHEKEPMLTPLTGSELTGVDQARDHHGLPTSAVVVPLLLRRQQQKRMTVQTRSRHEDQLRRMVSHPASSTGASRPANLLHRGIKTAVVAGAIKGSMAKTTGKRK